MSSQFVRIGQYTKGSLQNIGDEVERADREHKNPDIDKELSHLNHSYVSTNGQGMYKRFYQVLAETGCKFADKDKQVAFEGMVITSDREFFESLGWVKGEPPNKAVQDFFDRCYEWAKKQIGHNGSDKNILSAHIHYDETTPHLQIYYIPMTDKIDRKVYAKGADGKILRNEKGSPVVAKDEKGKTITEVGATDLRVSRDQFWHFKEGGDKHSYEKMQDDYQEQIGKLYGLDRGEKGTKEQHTSKAQWLEKQKKEKAEKEELDKMFGEIPECPKELPRTGTYAEWSAVRPLQDFGGSEIKRKQEYKKQKAAYEERQNEITEWFEQFGDKAALRENYAKTVLREQGKAERKTKTVEQREVAVSKREDAVRRRESRVVPVEVAVQKQVRQATQHMLWQQALRDTHSRQIRKQLDLLQQEQNQAVELARQQAAEIEKQKAVHAAMEKAGIKSSRSAETTQIQRKAPVNPVIKKGKGEIER